LPCSSSVALAVVFRRHPERSEGPLYLLFIFAVVHAFLVVIPEGDLLLLAVSTRVRMTVMLNDQQPLTVEVETEVGALISQLHQAGWIVSVSRYDAKAFGNWYVELRRANGLIRLSKDRSQYQIDGSNIEEIKSAGLWRAFDDLEHFRRAVGNWIVDSDISSDATVPPTPI
jgi:hypothetical protein